MVKYGKSTRTLPGKRGVRHSRREVQQFVEQTNAKGAELLTIIERKAKQYTEAIDEAIAKKLQRAEKVAALDQMVKWREVYCDQEVLNADRCPRVRFALQLS